MPKRKVIVSITDIPPTATCFLTDRIPPEIRGRILRQLLIKRSPIEIRYIRPRGTPGEPENRYYISTHREHPHHPGSTALLQTCKLISTEATQVLYGGNEFSFREEESLLGFLRIPGAGKHLMQKVRITGNTNSMLGTSAFWNYLLPLTNLRTITLGHSRMCQGEYRSVEFGLLQTLAMPLMRTLRDFYETQRLKVDPSDLLQVEADFCEACNCTCEVRHKWPNGGKCPKPSNDRLAFDERHAELVRSVKATLEKAVRAVDLDSKEQARQPKKALRRRLRA
ncbi:hypothetical protein LTR95_016734 [Oleoguttula sp. CCFEE 5521]